MELLKHPSGQRGNIRTKKPETSTEMRVRDCSEKPGLTGLMLLMTDWILNAARICILSGRTCSGKPDPTQEGHAQIIIS